MKQRRRRESVPVVSPERFVTTWQQSSSVGEVAMRLGLKKAVCRTRASRLRARGVGLKRFPFVVEREPTDWDALAALAASLLPEPGAGGGNGEAGDRERHGDQEKPPGERGFVLVGP